MQDRSSGKLVYYSCGKCASCLEVRRKQWLFRLYKELEYSSFGLHLTLQLSDDNLGDCQVHKEKLQKFIKRLRYYDYEFKYYGIGEYGTQDHRPHYHLALFFKQNYNRNELIKLIDEQWPYGYVYKTKLTFRRCGYILHYHIRPKIVDERPTFQIFSKGLGSEWFEEESVKEFYLISNAKNVHFQGNNVCLPRYYRKKMGQEANLTDYEPAFKKTYSEIMHKPFEELTKSDINNLIIFFCKKSIKKINKYNLKKL